VPSYLGQPRRPVYPAEARQQRVQGDVVLRARIGKTGRIESLRVISGPELLRQAAYDAVRSWRYRPVVINGKTSTVTTTITAHFVMR
jgi:protein TonB